MAKLCGLNERRAQLGSRTEGQGLQVRQEALLVPRLRTGGVQARRAALLARTLTINRAALHVP